MLRKLDVADTRAAIFQPVAFILAMVMGFGALSAPYAIASLIRQYSDVHFAVAGLIAIGISALCLYSAYLAARGRGALLYLPALILVAFSLWGNAVLFGL